MFDAKGHALSFGFIGLQQSTFPTFSLVLWAMFLLSRSKFVSYFGENVPEEHLISCIAQGCVESTLSGHFF